MIEEASTSLKAALYCRVASPLYGTFVVSWALFNWRPLAILFFDDSPVSQRIEQIEQLGYHGIFLGAPPEFLFYPLVATIFFIFVFPYPAKIVYAFSKKKAEELKKIKNDIEAATPLTVEESNKLRVAMAAQETRVNELLKEKENNIEALRGLLREKDATIEEHRKKIEDISSSTTAKELVDREREAMRNVRGIKQLGSEIPTKDIDFEYHDLKNRGKLENFNVILSEIVRNGGRNIPQENVKTNLFLQILEASQNREGYSLTDKGKRFAYLHEAESPN